MVVADPVIRSKINLSYAGVSQLFFCLSKSLFAKTLAIQKARNDPNKKAESTYLGQCGRKEPVER
jgi:hypothetical protein